jgi:hypothetical protein
MAIGNGLVTAGPLVLRPSFGGGPFRCIFVTGADPAARIALSARPGGVAMEDDWQYPPAPDLPPCLPPVPLYPVVVILLCAAGAAARIVWSVWPSW